MTFAEKFGQFVLRSRYHAVGFIILFTLIPFLSWVGVVIIVLVTLRKGIGEGLLTLLWGSLPYVILLALRQWMPVIDGVVFGSLLVWLFAVILRRFANWRWVIEGGAILGVLGVLALYLFVPNVQHFWTVAIMKMITQFIHATKIPLAMGPVKKSVAFFTQFATGIQASIILFTVFSELMLGRFIESKLVRQNLWWHEWLNLRLDIVALLVLMVGFGLAWFNVPMTRDILPVLMLPFLLAGVSLTHGLMVMRQVPRALVILFYVLLMMAIGIFPIFLSLFIIVAIADVLFNFRKRILKRVAIS